MTRKTGFFIRAGAILAVMVAFAATQWLEVVSAPPAEPARPRLSAALEPDEALPPEPGEDELAWQDLAQPYPQPQLVDSTLEFELGPAACGDGIGVVPDPGRGVVHVVPPRDGPEHALALDPRTGEVVYEHSRGLVPLAVVGNRLLLQGEGRLWIVDTREGAAVLELPLDVLPESLTERSYTNTRLRVRQRLRTSAQVLVALDWRKVEPTIEGSLEEIREQYAFLVDLSTGQVSQAPPEAARSPLEPGLVMDDVRLKVTGMVTRAFDHPSPGGIQQPIWKHTRRSLYRKPYLPPQPPTPLPLPYPTARATGQGQPFQPGELRRPYSQGGLADPTRGVFHVMRGGEHQDLVAVEPETGAVVYTHAAGAEPLALVGNRLLARDEGRLWILDTQDGQPVFELVIPQLPPLMSVSERRTAHVALAHHQGTVVRVATYLAEKGEASLEADDSWTVVRYVFGVDMAKGEVVAAPPEEDCELMSHELEVGPMRLAIGGGMLTAANMDRDWRQNVWKVPVRALYETPAGQ